VLLIGAGRLKVMAERGRMSDGWSDVREKLIRPEQPFGGEAVSPCKVTVACGCSPVG
jgi:hypothetical protein